MYFGNKFVDSKSITQTLPKNGTLVATITWYAFYFILSLPVINSIGKATPQYLFIKSDSNHARIFNGFGSKLNIKITRMNNLEYWLRGPVDGIPALLQPVAHAILQARDEVQMGLKDFPEKLIWERPASVASVAFHLQHMAGVLDRLLTYADGNQLDEQHLAYLKVEGKENHKVSLADLLDHFSKQVDLALTQIRNTTEESLLEVRGVGRKLIPSNVLGLLFHAAEHVQRHTGQLLVTASVARLPAREV